MTKGNAILKARGRERSDYFNMAEGLDSNQKYKRNLMSPAINFGTNS